MLPFRQLLAPKLRLNVHADDVETRRPRRRTGLLAIDDGRFGRVGAAMTDDPPRANRLATSPLR